jgi:hypothetical protein
MQGSKLASSRVNEPLAGVPPTVAVGPVMPGWGSWEWVGRDLRQALSRYYTTTEFGWDEAPQADVVLVVKHPLWSHLRRRLPTETPVIYCPVDHYGSPAEIQADAAMLSACARVVVHCHKLLRHFAPFAAAEYVDHHVKYVPREMAQHWPEGAVLWVGVRSNLPYLIEWAQQHPFAWPLEVLTNLEDTSRDPSARELGFPSGCDVRIEPWSPARHLACLSQARGALDVKGDDFRQRHKPPAKALDFLAAGLPLAMNADSSSAEHLARLGFEVADPLDTDRWFSLSYWQETHRFGQALRELLSLERITRRYRHLIDSVWQERQEALRERRGLTVGSRMTAWTWHDQPSAYAENPLTALGGGQ